MPSKMRTPLINITALTPLISFSKSTSFSNLIPEFFKGGLLHKDYDDHRVQRRIMQTAFKSDSLRAYTEAIIDEVQSHVESWAKKGDIILFKEIKQRRYKSSDFNGITKRSHKKIKNGLTLFE